MGACCGRGVRLRSAELLDDGALLAFILFQRCPELLDFAWLTHAVYKSYSETSVGAGELGETRCLTCWLLSQHRVSKAG
jgi:hypothetical protein